MLERVIEELVSHLDEGDQIVVVDDGSTDGTEEMVRRLLADVTYLKVPVNQGYMISTRINQGLELANNDMIWRLDSDCTPVENCLKLLKDNFEKCRIIAGAVLYEDERGELEGPDHPYRLNYMQEMRLHDPQMFSHWMKTCEVFDPILCFGGNMCFSKEKAMEVDGFDPDFDGAWGNEDNWFAEKMMRRLSVSLLYAPGAGVRHQWHPLGEDHRRQEVGKRNLDLWTQKSKELSDLCRKKGTKTNIASMGHIKMRIGTITLMTPSQKMSGNWKYISTHWS